MNQGMARLSVHCSVSSHARRFLDYSPAQASPMLLSQELFLGLGQIRVNYGNIVNQRHWVLCLVLAHWWIGLFPRSGVSFLSSVHFLSALCWSFPQCHPHANSYTITPFIIAANFSAKTWYVCRATNPSQVRSERDCKYIYTDGWVELLQLRAFMRARANHRHAPLTLTKASPTDTGEIQ